MKIKLFVVVLITAVCSTAIFAQRGMSVEDRMKELDKELDLSEKQYAKIENILDDTMKKFRKLRDEADGDREEMREKGRKMRRETNDKILEELNDEQKKKYKKYIEERRRNRSERRSPD